MSIINKTSLIFFFYVSISTSQELIIEKLTIEDYLSDLTFLNTVIKKQHPNPYKYVSEGLQKKEREKAIQQLKKETTYFNFIKCLNNLGDGHLSYITPEEYTDYMIDNFTFFPFPIIIRKGKMFVNIKGAKLKYGTEVLSIQNKPVKEVLEIFNKYKHGDGYIMSNTESLVSDIFSIYYSIYIYEKTEIFEIEYLQSDSNKKEKTKINSIDYYEWYRNQKLAIQPIDKFESDDYIVSRYYKRERTGVISVNTFSLDETSAYKKFSAFFKKINNDKYQNIIIDLRDNLGGDPRISALLFSFIINSNFKNSFNYKMSNINLERKNLLDNYENPASNEYINNYEAFLYQRFNKKDSIYVGNERLNEGVLGNFPPDKDNFKGNVYLIIGGKTFSAAVYFAKLFKDNRRGKIIGIETGGNENNTFAGYFLNYKLPKTKIIVRIPITELFFNLKKESIRGILPDINIPMKKYSEYFNKEQDPEVQYLIDNYIPITNRNPKN